MLKKSKFPFIFFTLIVEISQQTRKESTMATVTVTRPDLTDEERAKRMKAIKEAATRLVLATEKAKISKEYIGVQR